MVTTNIEALLRWAYVMELPKSAGGAWGASAIGSSWAIVERVGALGTMVDVSAWGTGDDATDPHPDALTVAAAVEALDDESVAEGDAHDLLAGWPNLGVAGERAVARAWDIVTYADDGHRWLRSPISALVRRIAILGLWPAWDVVEPAVIPTLRRGKPQWRRSVRQAVQFDAVTGIPTRWEDVELDGYDVRRQRPHVGAYPCLTLEPDPAAGLAHRIEWGLTHAALRRLAVTLDGLGGRVVLPPAAPVVPWVEWGRSSGSDENSRQTA
ncbi:hypothetical protein [Siculibacillus lacustris]|nr:hypothetical protein [Siculibacillus lacustris]